MECIRPGRDEREVGNKGWRSVRCKVKKAGSILSWLTGVSFILE